PVLTNQRPSNHENGRKQTGPAVRDRSGVGHPVSLHSGHETGQRIRAAEEKLQVSEVPRGRKEGRDLHPPGITVPPVGTHHAFPLPSGFLRSSPESAETPAEPQTRWAVPE